MIEFIIGLCAGAFAIWISFVTKDLSTLSSERMVLYKKINLLSVQMLFSQQSEDRYNNAQFELIFYIQAALFYCLSQFISYYISTPLILSLNSRLAIQI
jgi:hypothetical protein